MKIKSAHLSPGKSLLAVAISSCLCSYAIAEEKVAEKDIEVVTVQVLCKELIQDQAARQTSDLYRTISGITQFSYSGYCQCRTVCHRHLVLIAVVGGNAIFPKQKDTISTPVENPLMMPNQQTFENIVNNVSIYHDMKIKQTILPCTGEMRLPFKAKITLYWLVTGLII